MREPIKTTCSPECCLVSTDQDACTLENIRAHVEKHRVDKSCECDACTAVRRTLELWPGAEQILGRLLRPAKNLQVTNGE